MSKPNEMNRDLQKSRYTKEYKDAIDYQTEKNRDVEDLSVDYSIVLNKPKGLYKSLKIFLISEAVSIGTSVFFKLVMFDKFLKLLGGIFGTQFINKYLELFNTLKLFTPTAIDVLQIVFLLIILLEYMVFLLNPDLFKTCIEAKKEVRAYFENPNKSEKPDLLTLLLGTTFVANAYKMLENYLAKALNIIDPVYELPTSLRFTIQARIVVEVLVCMAITILF